MGILSDSDVWISESAIRSCLSSAEEASLESALKSTGDAEGSQDIAMSAVMRLVGSSDSEVHTWLKTALERGPEALHGLLSFEEFLHTLSNASLPEQADGREGGWGVEGGVVEGSDGFKEWVRGLGAYAREYGGGEAQRQIDMRAAADLCNQLNEKVEMAREVGGMMDILRRRVADLGDEGWEERGGATEREGVVGTIPEIRKSRQNST